MSYRETKLANARAGTVELTHDPTLDAMYLAGSLTAGLGSPSSDVDVFAITSDAHGSPPRQVVVGDERLDIETYSVGWYQDVLRRLSEWIITRTDLRSKALTPTELDVLLRLRESEVIKDSPSFQDIRSRLGRNEKKVRQMALAMWAIFANGTLSDFRGSMEDKDYASAGLIGQTLLVHAGKAVAAATGDLYYGTKWVLCQLRRSAGPGFPLERFSYLQSGAWARQDAASGATDALNLAQTMVVAAQTLGWDATAVTEWPFWLPGTGRVRRNPDFHPIHLSEGVLLNHELRGQFVVQPHVALVWGLCNGRDEDEVVEATLTLAPHVMPPGQPPLNGQRVQRILGSLEQRGLIACATVA